VTDRVRTSRREVVRLCLLLNVPLQALTWLPLLVTPHSKALLRVRGCDETSLLQEDRRLEPQLALQEPVSFTLSVHAKNGAHALEVRKSRLAG